MHKDRLNNLATAVLVLCAVTLTWRAVFSQQDRQGSPAPPKPTRYAGWKQLADSGTFIGPIDAKVIITEFSDFQCPYCRRLFASLQELRSKFPNDTAISYRHFPIENRHRHARAAALASECAAKQGKFEAYHDALFSKQDSIGKIPWTRFAVAAQIADTTALTNCLRDSATVSRIASDLKAGTRISVRGTPTVLVNEWRYTGTPLPTALESQIREILGRRNPR